MSEFLPVKSNKRYFHWHLYNADAIRMHLSIFLSHWTPALLSCVFLLLSSNRWPNGWCRRFFSHSPTQWRHLTINSILIFFYVHFARFYLPSTIHRVRGMCFFYSLVLHQRWIREIIVVNLLTLCSPRTMTIRLDRVCWCVWNIVYSAINCKNNARAYMEWDDHRHIYFLCEFSLQFCCCHPNSFDIACHAMTVILKIQSSQGFVLFFPFCSLITTTNQWEMRRKGESGSGTELEWCHFRSAINLMENSLSHKHTQIHSE